MDIKTRGGAGIFATRQAGRGSRRVPAAIAPPGELGRSRHPTLYPYTAGPASARENGQHRLKVAAAVVGALSSAFLAGHLAR